MTYIIYISYMPPAVKYSLKQSSTFNAYKGCKCNSNNTVNSTAFMTRQVTKSNFQYFSVFYHIIFILNDSEISVFNAFVEGKKAEIAQQRGIKIERTI